MRKRVILLPLLTLILGACGGYIRQKQLTNGFDRLGLAVPGDRWGLMLIVLSVLAALLAVLLTMRLKPRAELDASVLSLRSPIHAAVNGLASLVLLAAALLTFTAFRGVERDALRVDGLSIFSAVTAICTAVFSLTLYRRGELNKCGIVATIPVIYMCFWLVVAYREQAANPTTLAFVYEILAIMCGTMSFYYAAGALFTRPHPRRMLFFSQLCIYFTLVCAAETAALQDYLLLVFLALYMMSWSIALLRNAFE